MTEKFLEEISVLSAKNQKVQESFGRLERQGTTKFLCGLLSKIIQDEKTFIQNEPKREGKDQTADDEIENFKEGLNGLVHIIVEHAYESGAVLKENLPELEKSSKTRLLTVELEKSASEILDTIGSKSRLLNVPSSIHRHQSNERFHNSKNKVHTLPSENRNNSFDYRGGLLQIKNYKRVPYIDEDLYKRLQSKHKMRSRNQNNSFDTSFRLPSIKNSRLKSGKKDMSFEHINSEFNFIKGAVSFGNSKRKIFVGQSDIPGPATYKTEMCTPRQYRKSPTPIIGKAPKSTWIDAFSRGDSPGPGHLYPSKHLVLK